MQTSLLGIAKKAAEQRKYRFRNLYGMLNENFLLACWRDIRKNAAYGVDRVSARDYEKNLRENIRLLVQKLKDKRYRAQLIRRHYIPKGEGKFRPLGIPVVEDKLVQIAVKRLLEAIYEQDFLRWSHGYRPNTGAHNAIEQLSVKLQFGKYEYVVEADIKGFFDNMDHDWLIRMLEERIDDKAMLRLIKKWLKAGVLDTDGKVNHPVTGSPQGGIISPVLSNIYLHYVLDLWFHKGLKKRCKGEALMVRYADDFVAAFQYEAEAKEFYSMLSERLKKFGLELSAEKTRILPFSRIRPFAKDYFEFLGFEFRWGLDQGRKPKLLRRTSRPNLRRSLARLREWLRGRSRHYSRRRLFAELSVKFRGYYNYYGLIGNSVSLRQFHYRALRLVKCYLNRGSDSRHLNWQGFVDAVKAYNVPKPRIISNKRLTGYVPYAAHA